MKLTAWLKKVMKIRSPSEEMQKASAECAFYVGVIAAKYLEAIDGALNAEKEADE